MGLISRVSSRTYRYKKESKIMDVKGLFLGALCVAVGFVFQIGAGISSGNWITMVSMVFIVLGVPALAMTGKDGSSPAKEWCCFFAAAMLSSSIIFPIVMGYTNSNTTTLAGWLSG